MLIIIQGESVYKEASQELSAVGEEASKGLGDLRSTFISRTRGLSLAQTGEQATTDKDGKKEVSTDEALKESEGVLARLRTEAAKRLKDIQEAEDAADEALLKFGTNIRNFLKDAVSIAPPTEGSDGKASTVLFESKDASGKRVIHTTRFDAQLHVIHSSLDSFTKDPVSEEYDAWTKSFSAESKTEDISKDLENFAELRASMEKLVPDTVTYEDFWKRYYFLRHSIETAEARRRDLLKGMDLLFNSKNTLLIIYRCRSFSRRRSRLGRRLRRRNDRQNHQTKGSNQTRIRRILNHPPPRNRNRNPTVSPNPPQTRGIPQITRREIPSRQRRQLRCRRCCVWCSKSRPW